MNYLQMKQIEKLINNCAMLWFSRIVFKPITNFHCKSELVGEFLGQCHSQSSIAVSIK